MWEELEGGDLNTLHKPEAPKNVKIIIKKNDYGMRFQRNSSACTILQEDSYFVPRTLTGRLKITFNPISRNSDYLFGSPQAPSLMCINRTSTQIHITKTKINLVFINVEV